MRRRSKSEDYYKVEESIEFLKCHKDDIFDVNRKYDIKLFNELNNHIVTDDSQEDIIDYTIRRMDKEFIEFISERDNYSIDYLSKKSIIETYQVPYLFAFISFDQFNKLRFIEKYPISIYSNKFFYKNKKMTNTDIIRLTYHKLNNGQYLYPTSYKQKNLDIDNNIRLFICGNSPKDDVNDIFREILDKIEN